MPIKLTVLLFLLLLTLSFFTGAGLTYYSMVKKTNKNTSNILLHELSNELKLIEIVNTANSEMPSISTQLNNNFVETIIAVSILEPDASILDSISLETLCKAIKLNKKGYFNDASINDTKILAVDYLNNIENRILTEIGKLQKIFKGRDCSTTAN